MGNSNEIQSVLLPKKEGHRHVSTKKNPLKNNSVLGRLCPFAPAEKRRAKLAHQKRSSVAAASATKVKKHLAAKKAHVPKKKAFYKELESAHAVKVAEVEEAEEEE